MDWTWFALTAIGIALAVLVFLACRFFRKAYFMIEEIDDRLIQIRDMLKEAADTKAATKGATAAGGVGVRPAPPAGSGAHRT